MLIEQAFMALPETLVGSGYAKQQYEASIVAAYSMALLGELNGRNVSNPMACIRAERKFIPETDSLRADLNVDLSRVATGSKAMSQLGFRFDNWIEAKFFRGLAASTQNLGQIAADIIRLAGLLPLAPDANSLLPHGRYLLHAYLGDPMKFLAPRRKGRDEPDRAWVDPLLKPGRKVIDSLELDNESATFYTFLGSALRNCAIRIEVTNFVISPPNSVPQPNYTLVLTRIDAGNIRFDGRGFIFNNDRTYEVQPAGDYEALRSSIAKALKSDNATQSGVIEELESPEAGA